MRALWLAAIPVVVLLAMAVTETGWVYWDDYVSEDTTACHYFTGVSLGVFMLVDGKVTPKCPTFQKVGRFPACWTGHERYREPPKKSCEAGL